MKDKRGLSAVVTTLIIILLVLVAIGIIWAIVRNLIETGGEQITSKAACIGVQVNIKNAPCKAGFDCVVTVERLSGGGDIDGAKVTISQGTNTYTKSTTGGLDVLDTVDVTLDTEVATNALVTGAATVKAAAVTADGTVCDLIDTEEITVAAAA